MRTSLLIALLALTMVLLPLGLAQQQTKPYKVTITQEKPAFTDSFVPLDTKPRITWHDRGKLDFGVSVEGKKSDEIVKLADSIKTLFLIDRKIIPTAAGKLKQGPLEGLTDGGRKRHGLRNVWDKNGVRVVMTVEAVPGKHYQPKPAVPKVSRMDTLLIKYLVENTSQETHRFGCRAAIDNHVMSSDVIKYFSPTTHPHKTVDGIFFDGKDVPEFMEALENDDLNNPGVKGTFTFKFGEKLEGPNKVVLTQQHLAQGEQWFIGPQVGKRSCCVLYWETRDLQPGEKRELAYGYGQGIATHREGVVRAEFAGSFDPGKSFTITAYVDDPVAGQTLTLQLPKGVERIDGKATQAVPGEAEKNGYSVVWWRCRTTQIGTFPISIRSNNGATRTWTVTVSAPD